jgi:hypothetical protein
MGQLYSISDFSRKFEGRPVGSQQELLERAVAKLVLIGEQVGVSAGQMIVLLESGLTIGELLEYLDLRNGQIRSDAGSTS